MNVFATLVSFVYFVMLLKVMISNVNSQLNLSVL